MTDGISPPHALLDPARAVLVLIDYQPMTLFGVHPHDAQAVVNNVVALARAAKAFGVPTILTTVAAEGIGGHLLPELQNVAPDQQPIDRTWISAWEDPALRDAVLATGRDQIVLAGLWTEMCVAFPALYARKDGHDVFVAADASGGASREAHDEAIRRMAPAGVVPVTAQVVLGELQRDWAGADSPEAATAIATDHFGNWGRVSHFYSQHAAAKGHAERQAA